MKSPLQHYLDWLIENPSSNYDSQKEKLFELMEHEKMHLMAAFMGFDGDKLQEEGNPIPKEIDEKMDEAILYFTYNYPEHPKNLLNLENTK